MITEILDPTGSLDIGTQSVTPSRLGINPGAVLARARLGVIENGNANADFVLDRLATGVVNALGWDREIIWVRKPTAGEGASSSDLDRLAEECGLVLAGTAD